MKKVFKVFLCLLSIVSLSSCTISDYKEKEIIDMNIIELNQYNEYLKQENQKLKEEKENIINNVDDRIRQDVIDVINYVNTEVIKSNVMITNESKSFFHSTSVSSGSGTIIKEDNNYYYVLTNNHVIYSLGNRSSYYVYDYLNNEYSATIMFKDPNYDMALLRFNKGNKELRVSEVSSSDILVDEDVIVIGQPLGQRNAISFGKVLRYGLVNCNDCNPLESNIQYECVFYDAMTTNGNSGGMIINSDYKLVGVVTYGLNGANGDYMYGAGSPISKVREFLSNNNFEVGDYNA